MSSYWRCRSQLYTTDVVSAANTVVCLKPQHTLSRQNKRCWLSYDQRCPSYHRRCPSYHRRGLSTNQPCLRYNRCCLTLQQQPTMPQLKRTLSNSSYHGRCLKLPYQPCCLTYPCRPLYRNATACTVRETSRGASPHGAGCAGPCTRYEGCGATTPGKKNKKQENENTAHIIHG